MSPADSLLYAPVTVIVEGDTEVACLLPLIRKVASTGRQGFDDLTKLLGLCHFLDGRGSTYELLCRFARSHGTRVVLFLDGDKRQEVERQRARQLITDDVQVVFTPGQSEFEELVPSPVYIRAAVELVGETFTDDLVREFDAWTTNGEPWRPRLAFSKRVQHWFEERFVPPFQPKATVMIKSIELVDGAQIEAQPIAELLTAVREALRGSSFE